MGSTLAVEVMPDYFEQMEARMLQEFAAGVKAWSRSVTALSAWEHEHLLDNPSSEALASHRDTVERLIRFGRFLAITTDHPEFPDPILKRNVAATLQTLRDKISLWHGTMQKAEADSILKAAFPE